MDQYKSEKKLIEYMKHFQLLDLLAFGKMLDVQEEDDFDEYMVNIIAAFSEKNRGDRRKLLKLARLIKENNDEFDRLKDSPST